jgi:hypothetical protein
LATEARSGCGRAGEGGQSTVEWLGLVALVTLALAGLAWVAGTGIPGLLLAKTIAEKVVCAVRLTDDCGFAPELKAANGAEVAALLQAHAPALLYEDGMTAMPVDYRRCREDGCAAGPGEGVVARTDSGERPVAFTHAIDCRADALRSTETAGADCSGDRRGNLYLQYWLYYPGSATAEGSTPLKGPIRTVSAKLGHSTYHPDDWESYTVRIGPAGRFARASSHRGYGDGWEPDSGAYYISGGSHAGRTGKRRVSWLRPKFVDRYGTGSRTTKDHRLKLIPIETLAGRDSASFAVSPPWRKRVFFDPEYSGTD